MFLSKNTISFHGVSNEHNKKTKLNKNPGTIANQMDS